WRRWCRRPRGGPRRRCGQRTTGRCRCCPRWPRCSRPAGCAAARRSRYAAPRRCCSRCWPGRPGTAPGAAWSGCRRSGWSPRARPGSRWSASPWCRTRAGTGRRWSRPCWTRW
ncbi:MAG: hypothetical protein AVDCRST_MAG41-853, partial [uncultured Corynebacteriales bacterium]